MAGARAGYHKCMKWFASRSLAAPSGLRDQRAKKLWQRLAVVAWRRHQAPVLWMHVKRPFWGPEFFFAEFVRLQSTETCWRKWSEVFSGTCRTQQSLAGAWATSVASDKDPERAEHCTVANYDLTEPEKFATLITMLQADKDMLVHAHCAPSCEVLGARMASIFSLLEKFRNLEGPQALTQQLPANPFTSGFRVLGITQQ